MTDSTFSLELLSLDLHPSADPTVIAGKKVPGYDDRHLAKDEWGNPLLLISTLPSRIPPAVILENLKVEHGIRCKITDPDGTLSEGTFSIIQCTSPQASLKSYFIRLMDSVIQLIASPARTEDISNAVDRLATLFLALRRTPSRPIQGLWAELFLIVTSKDPLTMLKAWHNEPTERFDFSCGLDRIEVKGSGNRTRSHHFTYHQAHPPKELSVFVASLYAEDCVGGTSLGDLWDRARYLAGSNANLRLKIDQICTEVLGSDWDRARDRSFDDDVAKDSLAFYDIRDIPKVPWALPDGVSDVRFVADLMRVTPSDASKSTNRLVQSYSRSKNNE